MSEILESERRAPPVWQFSIGGILLVITLIAICLALLRLTPCLGVKLTIVCLPAAVRSAINVRHYARLGERMSIAEKSTDFALSFFIVLWPRFWQPL